MDFKVVFVTILIVSIISGLLGLLVALFSKYFSVKKDDKVEEVLHMLPGYNCGGCGKAGCRNFAEAIVYENEDYNKCKPMKKENKEELKKYLQKN